MSRAVRSLRALSSVRFAAPSRTVARAVPAITSVPSMSASRSYASGPTAPCASDSARAHAQALLDDGTRALEEGDMQRAKSLYEQSVAAAATSGGYFNLGVCEYQLSNLEGAIEAWKQSIQLEPSADAYTNLGSAYMMSRPPRAADAIKALTAAMDIAPEDPEIQFNLAAVLESTDALDHALTLYKKAQAGGIERAAVNIRNVGAKILGKRIKEEEGKA